MMGLLDKDDWVVTPYLKELGVIECTNSGGRRACCASSPLSAFGHLQVSIVLQISVLGSVLFRLGKLFLQVVFPSLSVR
jgi:hypothetical protein